MTKKKKPRPLDAPTLWKLDRVGAIALSPDGRRLVCSLTRPDADKNETRTSLWRLPLDGGAPSPLTTTGQRDGQPAWSPKGDRLAFVARREQEGEKDETPQLYLLPADGGEARRASRFAPGVEAFKWMPDGRRIVFAAWVWPQLKGAAAQAKRHKEEKERKDSGYATSAAFYRYWDHNLPQGRVLHLLLLDLASGRVTDLFEGTALELPRHGPGADDFDPRPDGRAIAFNHDPAAEPVLGNRCVVSEIDLKSRRVKQLAGDPAWDFFAPRYAPDGRRVALLAANTGRHHTALPQLAVAEGGRWRVLAPGWDRNAESPLRWAADGQSVCFAAEDRGRRPLWRQRLHADAPERLHEGGWVQAFEMAGDTLAVVADSARHPPRVFVREGALPARRVESFNDALLREVALGDVREVGVTGAQGDPVQLWLAFPPGFDPKKKHPVTHDIHGGPYAASGDTWSWRWNLHVLASTGHVVAALNYHGSSGFGFAFRQSIMGRQGELEFQDIEAASDWLLKQRWCDRRRLHAAGGSYGGFLAAWMNGHAPARRYRAMVCHAGVFDRVATFSADSYPERPKDLAARWWDDMPRVLAQSPHASAARMATPTLVVHGALDYRVPDCNGLAYYNTLKARGVPARLLWFADENHWILKPRNSLQWYREVLAWLDGETAGATAGPASRRASPRGRAALP